MFITSIILLGLMPFSTAYGSDHPLLNKTPQIDAEIVQNMSRFNIPGMAFVLADEKGIIYTKGYGLNEFNGNEKVSNTTNFRIGSISKVFTSLAIIQLRDQGLIELDAPVKQYLPWFTTKDIPLSNSITIRNLLDHTSGLPSRLNAHDIEGSDVSHIELQLKRKLQGIHLVASPGEQYEYTNMNFDLLQLIIEKVTSLSFPDYMQKNVFQPLGMNRTTFSTQDVLPNSATGHRYIWGNIHPFRENLSYASLGSAGLSTNAEDLGKYISFLLSPSLKVDNSVLQVTSLSKMHRPAIYDGSIGHGHGWDITVNTIEKTGGLPGFTANLIVYPGRSYGFALLSNSKQNITDETNFNISRILEGRSPSYLSKKDFPVISSVNKLILYLSVLLTVIVLLMWLPALILGLRKKARYSFKRPNLPIILICWILNGIGLIGVFYGIYAYIPYQSGTPSLYLLTTAPDSVNGLTLFSIVYLTFSISLACKPIFRRPPNGIENQRTL